MAPRGATVTTIRTTCPDCGDVELAIDDVKLEHKQYRFDCPWCGQTQRRPASYRVVEVLLAVGVESVELGPITEAEIQAFVVDLRNGVEL